jgi:hypothetical protein
MKGPLGTDVLLWCSPFSDEGGLHQSRMQAIAPDPTSFRMTAESAVCAWRIVIYVMAITYREPAGSEDSDNKKGWGRGVTKRKVDC